MFTIEGHCADRLAFAEGNIIQRIALSGPQLSTCQNFFLKIMPNNKICASKEENISFKTSFFYCHCSKINDSLDDNKASSKHRIQMFI